MAASTAWKQRLLFSIIRAPTLSHYHPSFTATLQIRSLYTSQAQRSTGFSVTFGPQIDTLLDAANGHTKKRASRIKTEGKDLKKVPHGTSSPPEAPSSNSNDVSLSRKATDGQPMKPELHKPIADDSDGDQISLELSDDAYDAVSKVVNTPKYFPGDRESQRLLTRGSTKSTYIDSKIYGGGDSTMNSSSRTAKITQGKESSSQILPSRTPVKRTEPWQIQKDALRKKFGEQGWNPRKKLSPDAIDGIRGLHEESPERYTTAFLAQHFKISPEAIRRILKSKWRPSDEKMQERRERWARRYDRIWDQQAALGIRPPRTKDRTPEGPEVFEEEIRAKKMLGQL